MKTQSYPRYPILLVHGTGYHDQISFIKYWGRIPERLERAGASVFLSRSDSWGTVENNARFMKREIDAILEKTGLEKINIIAHSKGGLDSRFLISKLGMGGRVASLTTISTPHRGSSLADFLERRFKAVEGIYTRVIDGYSTLLGDAHPASRRVLSEFTTTAMRLFNSRVPDDGRVYYASYACALKNGFDEPIFLVTYPLLFEREGPNDGLVSVDSSRWGDFQGVIKGINGRGISHWEVTDFKQRRASGINLPDVYCAMTFNLAALGF